MAGRVRNNFNASLQPYRVLVWPLRAFPIRHPLRPLWAWALILAVFAAGFGAGLFHAIRKLLDPSLRPESSKSWASTISDGITSSGVVAAATVCTVVIVYLVCGPGVLRWRGLRGELRAGGLAQTLALLSFMLMGWLNERIPGWPWSTGYPFHADPTAQDNVDQLWSSATAGFGEEPLFTVLIPVALRAAGCRWRTVLIASVVLRVSFHIYYGPTAVVMVMWALGAVLIVQRTGCLIGVAVIHSAWDLGPTLRSTGVAGLEVVGWVVTVGVIAICVWSLCELYRWESRAKKVTAASP